MKKDGTPQTLLEAVIYFSNDAKCVEFIRKYRWAESDGKPICPNCGSLNVCWCKTRPQFRCREKGCTKTFSLKTGSIMENSPLPITKWVPALWFIINHKNGCSSYEIARALGITQKAAWHLAHRIRKAVSNGSFEKMKGTVEIDESFIGGKTKFMHKSKRATLPKRNRRIVGDKTVVLGMRERESGEVRAKVVDNQKRHNLLPEIIANVSPDAKAVYTDTLRSYDTLKDIFANHESIDHSKEEWVRGDVHTQGMENFWSIFKRSIKGTYVHIAPFHIDRYLDEQIFRYNNRKNTDSGRFEKAASQIFGRRLTYKELIGDIDLLP